MIMKGSHKSDRALFWQCTSLTLLTMIFNNNLPACNRISIDWCIREFSFLPVLLNPTLITSDNISLLEKERPKIEREELLYCDNYNFHSLSDNLSFYSLNFYLQMFLFLSRDLCLLISFSSIFWQLFFLLVKIIL